ncbi:small ribosomal subunit protein mS25 [Denticeps clupeoides]|uniref:Small ribosomal subunit protein mS25 n=1 Tax=Denticeps clupeoides TaxID=299321 RepID=A0AAY4DFZ5_9TELE|nr:28S ribosomal protein S25, mitochondrial [Denticeps clupeoides]
MPMKGRFPIRRTLEYLQKGDIVFKNSVKIMTVNYVTNGKLSDGARKFVFFKVPQIQYKNPWVQIVMLKNMTPSPFLTFYLNDGEEVLVDVEGKDYKEISQLVRKILGKSDEALQAEAQQESANPANFGPKKYCLKQCMSEVEGQVPHPGLVPLPKEMRGKYRAQLASAAQD